MSNTPSCSSTATPSSHARSDQQQSPFFRLPRELRDDIYEAYAHHSEGVFYSYPSGKLRCKQAAEEIQDAALRANTVTFFPARSAQDGTNVNDLDSKAGRFERLVQCARRTKMHMLHFVAEGGCVTPEMVDQVATRFPGIARCYRKAYNAIKSGDELYKGTGVHSFDYQWRWQTSATFCDALHYTLELASSHPRFDDLIAESMVSPLSRRGMMPPFVPGCQNALLAWKPDLALIPTETDLALESFLADPVSPDADSRVHWTEPVVPLAWYFSATAVAVDFLKRLPHSTRMCLRLPLIIRENKLAVAYPESHARSLEPYLCENKNLRIDLHVGCWTNLTHPFWLRLPHSKIVNEGLIMKLEMIRPFADFLDEVLPIFDSIPRPQALSIYIEGHQDESLAAWESFKHAASLQEAMLKSDYMQRHEDVQLTELYDPLYWGVSLSKAALENRFQMPCHLPDSFYAIVRQITEGSGSIHFVGDAGAPWDAKSMIEARKHWTPQQFLDEWDAEIFSGFVSRPPGGVAAFKEMYKL
ncbi:uncharacterized protein J4E84_007403 [Alternaria hordeiaustralica]|uniref:uncharacterized protein n=1 Tax=Alternaria hordeiaustralica TaxID=1187925 RepID=UPI0020C56755|nr:uncharacterized protein J4E84_007403 [Alternaria hordeiaustralica]KAI4681807.1 hypothetical protein J4E84_007403 [Alternaria hordeiaustralica]